MNSQNVLRLVVVDQKEDQGVATLLLHREMGRRVREIKMKQWNVSAIHVQVSAQQVVVVNLFFQSILTKYAINLRLITKMNKLNKKEQFDRRIIPIYSLFCFRKYLKTTLISSLSHDYDIFTSFRKI